MYNKLTFLCNPVNKAQLLIHLTLWTFSVGSFVRRGFDLNPKPLCPLQGRGLTQKIAETDDFLSFLSIVGHAMSFLSAGSWR